MRSTQQARRITSCLLGVAQFALASACVAQPVPTQAPAEYRAGGERALEWTRRFVDLGPRPAGSEALRHQHRMIVDTLEGLSCSVEVDSFAAATPVGVIPMRNVIARFGPETAEPVVISGHYDTFRLDGFVGANDGGSSAGLLMALGERLDRAPPRPVWLVFFDGEESTLEWRDYDHTYGSRHLAKRWAADGTARRIRALLNVDMIGDADLRLVREGNSDKALREAVWSIARDLGYGHVLGRQIGYIEDDHIPFREVGVPSLNLIDFEYGPGNSYWHTAEDTLDKLDAISFATILHVVEAAIESLFDN